MKTTSAMFPKSAASSSYKSLGMAIAAAALVFVCAGAAVAGSVPIVGSGALGGCSFSGKMTLHPKMTFAGGRTRVSARLSGKLSNCTSGTGDGAHIVSASVRGLIRQATVENDCVLFLDGPLQGFDMRVTWRTSVGTPKLLSTVVHVGGVFVNVAGPGGGLLMVMAGSGALDGSFASNTFLLTTVTDETLAEVNDACMAHSNGLRQVKFTGVNAPSSMTD